MVPGEGLKIVAGIPRDRLMVSKHQKQFPGEESSITFSTTYSSSSIKLLVL